MGLGIHHIYGSLSMDSLRSIIININWIGIPFYIVCFTLGIIFFVPATPIAVVGGLMFGPWLGFAVLQASSLVSASVIYLMVRYGLLIILKKKDLSGLLPLRIYSRFHKNAILLIVYARTFMIPAPAINYSTSTLNVDFWDYFMGTLLGSLPHNFAVAFLCGIAHEAILENTWNELLQWKLIPVIVLTLFNIYLAHVLRKRRDQKH